MWTALHNYSPFLINSPVSAETSSGSTRGTCSNVHQERWLLLQAQKAPSLMCNRAAEPNMHLHCLLGLSQSHRLSRSTPAVCKISPVPHMAGRWQEVVGCSFKHWSVVSSECMVCSSRVPAVRRSWRQFWEALWYPGTCRLPAASGGNANSPRRACLSTGAPGSGAFVWFPIVTKHPNLNKKSSTHGEMVVFLSPRLGCITTSLKS